MASSQEGEKAKLEFSTESFDFRLHIVVFEQILEGMITESETAKDVLPHSKIELMRVKAKLKCLLEQMKSVKEVEELESKILQVRLAVNVKKAESVLQEMPEEEGLGAPGLEMQVEEDIAKSEFLREEMELIRVVKKVESSILEMQLKEHISKVESVLENMKLVREESNVESLELRMQLKDLEFLLEKLKSEQESGELKSLPMERELEGHIVKLKLLLEGTKERLQWPQMLEMELKNDIEKLKSLLVACFVLEWRMRFKRCLDAEMSLLEKMESLGEESRIMQLREHTAAFEFLLNDMKSVKLVAKLKLRRFEQDFYIHAVKTQLEKKLEQEELQLKELAAKSEVLWNQIKLKREKERETEKGHLAKLKNCITEINILLLRNIKYEPDDVFFMWDRTAKLGALLKKMKMVQREQELFSTWEMELDQRHTEELELLLEEMMLKQKKTLGIELLERLEFLVKEIDSEPDVEIPMFAALKKTLEEHLAEKNEEKRREEKRKENISTRENEIGTRERKTGVFNRGVEIAIDNRIVFARRKKMDGRIFLEFEDRKLETTEKKNGLSTVRNDVGTKKRKASVFNGVRDISTYRAGSIQYTYRITKYNSYWRTWAVRRKSQLCGSLHIPRRKMDWLTSNEHSTFVYVVCCRWSGSYCQWW